MIASTMIPFAHVGPHNLLEWLIYGGLLVVLGAVAVAVVVRGRDLP